MVLKVWVITKMLSIPIPRSRKGITKNRFDYDDDDDDYDYDDHKKPYSNYVLS